MTNIKRILSPFQDKKMHESFIETTSITSYWQFLRMVRLKAKKQINRVRFF
jgi:hypothetical protein